MATNNVTNKLSMLELARRRDASNNNITIIESLNNDYSIMQDAQWVEANGEKEHKLVKRATLPTGAKRRFYKGTPKEGSLTVAERVGLSMYQSYSEADKDLIDMELNPGLSRHQQAIAFLEGLGQTFESDMFYSTIVGDPDGFNGFATKTNTLANPMVEGCGGTGSNLTSAFLVQWGPAATYMVYPKNAPFFGVEHRDLGEHTTEDSDGNYFQVYRDMFSIKGGLCVADEKSLARICNIEASQTTGSNIIDYKLLIKIKNKMRKNRKTVLYCNSDVKTQFDIMAIDKSNGFYTQPGIFGIPVTCFQDIEIKLTDSIISTESAIV